MQILRIYGVFDQKAKCFIPPFFLQTDGMAVRAFSDCVNDKTHPWGKNPADYTLFHLGEFNDSDGGVSALKTGAAVLVNGMQVLRASVDERQQALFRERQPLVDSRTVAGVRENGSAEGERQ